MPDLVTRIRDLIHGFVYLSEIEEEVVNQPLFQRLRHIRQNDVGFYVYPSLNTTRFEHSLGVASVAGRMAQNIVESGSEGWEKYSRQTEISTHDFITISRLYALLHDIGHLPLSHLFEEAMAETIKTRLDQQGRRATAEDVIREAFGVESGEVGAFKKPHEYMGRVVANKILDDVRVSPKIKDSLLLLMTQKTLPVDSNLFPVKMIVDSEIDADRIDSVARDGVLAGGEYGRYDIERLCKSVFLVQIENRWHLGYSAKAISSLEALLFERYRVHTWVHFHHRVRATREAVNILVTKLLAGTGKMQLFREINGDVTKFQGIHDAWLFSQLESLGADIADDPAAVAAYDSLFGARRSGRVKPLWKTRAAFAELSQRIARRTKRRVVSTASYTREYETSLSRMLGCRAVVRPIPFQPLADDKTYLVDDAAKKVVGTLEDLSAVVRGLGRVWQEEALHYVFLFHPPPNLSKTELENNYVDFTVKWLDTRSE